ncbi:MAG: hypothetical protein WCF10_17705, partial [Polyangiales bacterium]
REVAMRYLIVCVLAGLLAWPQNVAAQAGEEGGSAVEQSHSKASAVSHAQHHAGSFKDREIQRRSPTPALQLGVDSAGLKVTPSAPLTAEELKLQEMDLRVRRARIALGVSVVPIFIGAILAGVGAGNSIFSQDDTSSADAAVIAGSAIMGAGGVSMIATGILLGVRKHQRREFKETQHGTARRLQWDLQTSRLVF